MTVCDLTGVDIAVYMFETDARKNVVRDAMATVLHERRVAENERQRMRQKPHHQ